MTEHIITGTNVPVLWERVSGDDRDERLAMLPAGSAVVFGGIVLYRTGGAPAWLDTRGRWDNVSAYSGPAVVIRVGYYWPTGVVMTEKRPPDAADQFWDDFVLAMKGLVVLFIAIILTWALILVVPRLLGWV